LLAIITWPEAALGAAVAIGVAIVLRELIRR
jgi:hypothetical protein